MTPSTPHPRPFLGKRVLVVDDDEHTRILLRDLCGALGFDVSLAEDGDAALATLERTAPDLVLLDLMMPRRDGFSVLEAVRQSDRHRALPVILLTAMGDLDGKIRGMELGADDYVTKPFKLLELQTRIQSVLLVRDYRGRLAAAEHELQALRVADPLTGAGTYPQLKASLDAEIARGHRYGRPAAVLLFGFDDYTALRYAVGRERCDQLVVDLARLVRTLFRGADRLFRTDVDEFVVLLPETDLEGAQIAAQRLAEVAARELQVDGQVLPTRLRVAGAAFPGERVHTSEDLLREANRVFLRLREAQPPKFVFGE